MNIPALLSIGKRIKDEVTEIKHIDIYNGQYMPDNDGQIKQFTKPAVLIEFGQTQWETAENGIQEGNGMVRIHVVLQKLNDTFKLFDKTDLQKAAMLDHYNIPKLVHAKLQGFSPDGVVDALNRINTIPDHDFNNTIVEIFEYEFRDYDDAADTHTDWVDVTVRDVVAIPTVEVP